MFENKLESSKCDAHFFFFPVRENTGQWDIHIIVKNKTEKVIDSPENITFTSNL